MALHAIRELDLDGWDLSDRIQVIDSLGNIGDGRLEAAIAAFHVMTLEAFGDLLGERHFRLVDLKPVPQKWRAG
jgi:hypothetical protein